MKLEFFFMNLWYAKQIETTIQTIKFKLKYNSKNRTHIKNELKRINLKFKTIYDSDWNIIYENFKNQIYSNWEKDTNITSKELILLYYNTNNLLNIITNHIEINNENLF